ncbi:MAG: ribulose-phosphate 3-epimerase [Candidatus Omnitrophica bacterium]|nr:ribulose-phosphate 3-epimerase [Candidatus Omnitrophota bacterium]
MSGRRLIIAPSLLACDFGRLSEEVQKVEEAGADWLHVDVMDGHFVPNLTMGPAVVDAIRRCSKLPLDIHLMIDHPAQYVRPFLDAGSSSLTPHVEAAGLKAPGSVEMLVDAVHRAKARAGLAIRPKTAAEALKPYLSVLDLVLVMTVEPGFGGQQFIPQALPKVRQLRQWYQGDISVDGGITEETGVLCRQAGANVLVAGTYVFKSSATRHTIQTLRGA